MKIPCKFALLAIVAALVPMSANAQDAYGVQDSYATDDYYSGVSAFEGVYAGIYTGARFNPGTAALLGVAVGANFTLMDNFVVGLEGQGGAAFGTTTNYDALMLGHVGYEVSDDVLVYGALGGGWINGAGSYAAGFGADVMVVDQISLRGEILGTGAWGGGMNGAKASIGAMWHLR